MGPSRDTKDVRIFLCSLAVVASASCGPAPRLAPTTAATPEECGGRFRLEATVRYLEATGRQTVVVESDGAGVYEQAGREVEPRRDLFVLSAADRTALERRVAGLDVASLPERCEREDIRDGVGVEVSIACGRASVHRACSNVFPRPLRALMDAIREAVPPARRHEWPTGEALAGYAASLAAPWVTAEASDAHAPPQ